MVVDHLDEASYQALVTGGEAIKRMPLGVKVWQLPDGQMVKLFRPRGWFSRSRLHRASSRFAANAKRLRALGFASVVVDRLIYVPAMGAHGVVYQRLAGQPLEEVMPVQQPSAELQQLALLMAQLHQAGVLFRALHLGNVLVQPGGGLALIDVEELTVSRRSLGVAARLRNFRHLLRRPRDRVLLGERGFDELIQHYLHHAALPPRRARKLTRQLRTLADQMHRAPPAH